MKAARLIVLGVALAAARYSILAEQPMCDRRRANHQTRQPRRRS